MRSKVPPIAAATVAVAAASVLMAGAAHAFGTVGHLAEHEHITRAALACGTPGGGPDCVEPRSLDQVAGMKGTFGAVGSPDNPLTGEMLTSAAHCDNADYVEGPEYRPEDRRRATAALLDCVDYARARVRAGVRRAADVLDSQGRVKPEEVSLKFSVIPPHPANCSFNRVRGRVKCDVIEEFGRALHAMQDFYSHSNWADEAAPGPIGVRNPPGGRQDDISPLFALFGPEPSDVPGWLTTGCFDAQAAISGERAGCTDDGRTRLKHAWINKDHGVIDPRTGAASCVENDKNVCTSRGQAGEDFARAVRGAVDDTRRQWRDFATAVRQAYPGRGDLIVCALAHDDPVRTCR
ncbi:hypothetical protein [Actinomadura sp. DC4]|uniref:hypothetical protein n=1 Tax=Actinomadura sp. DC4 TaxID=3055069 RepID=UPI0025B098E8|nr:hypothetical protein [Actinomadura sp. DC4]MDN3351322.1 hypothetical protein [Actinomadura sp. DC4]